MTAAMDRARAVIAEALAAHLPDGYGDHGCALRCGWSDEGTVDSAGEHLADAILAALVDEMGLREFVAYRPPMRKASWLETKLMEDER